MHRSEVRQVALHNLGAEPAQIVSALILPANQCAHSMSFLQQHGRQRAADATDCACRSGYENRAVVFRFDLHVIHPSR
jgi:hypothetical protein